MIERRFGCQIDHPQGKRLSLHFVAFDPSRFQDSDYSAHRIVMPQSIVRSVPARRAEFLAGRLAARDALAEIGEAPIDLPIGRMRAPVWPRGIIGSISHSNNLAAGIGMSNAVHRGVGLDIEQVVSAEVGTSLAEIAATRYEQSLFSRAAPDMSRRQMLTIIFSAKESLFKAISANVGRYLEFTAAQVAVVDAQAGIVTLEATSALSPAIGMGHRFAARFVLVKETVLTLLVW